MLSPSSSQAAHAEPQTVLDALQQRLNKYREAGSQARAGGDERKARMHERIAKVGLQRGAPAPAPLCWLLSARLSASFELLLPRAFFSWGCFWSCLFVEPADPLLQ